MKATSLSWWYLLRGPGSLCEAANPTVNVATRPWLSTGSCCGGAPFVLLTYWVPEVLAPNRHQGVYHRPLSQGEEEMGRVDVGGGAGGEERRGGCERCWTATAACESSLEGLTLHLPQQLEGVRVKTPTFSDFTVIKGCFPTRSPAIQSSVIYRSVVFSGSIPISNEIF